MSLDEKYIQRCFKLGLKAKGNTSPNPLVGAVIVKDDQVISEGYHQQAGHDHAELAAIKAASEDIKGSTLYCNLEPCCHTNKRTPPCAQRIIQEGISKVVISNLDPNPEVAGNGVKLLQGAGIEVKTDILEREGALLNEIFFTHIQKKRPFIHLKWAQTLDGKLATNTGDSKWITSETARHRVHQERMLYDAILVGKQTAINDNPRLTIRLNDQEICKKRIIIGSDIPKDLGLLTDQFKDQTITLSGDVEDVLEQAYMLGVYSIYVEGGKSVLNQLIERKLYDRVSIYTAPKILGSGQSLSFENTDKMSDAIKLPYAKWTVLGDEIILESMENICLQD